MGINLKLSSSPNGTRNVSFNPVVVATDQHVFGMDPSDTSNYLVPGNGQPAISTSAFYNASGLYNFRPYDLDLMGAEGAAVKAANGGRRYAWVCSADHPVFAYAWTGGIGFWAGFSFQPWDFPRKMNEIIEANNNWNSALYGLNNLNTYEFPTIFYNPDDPDGLPIYLFAENGVNQGCLWRSADFVTFTIWDMSHYHTPAGTFSSFVRYAKRNGPNDFTTIATSATSPGVGFCNAIWLSTDGRSYTSSFTPILGLEGSPDSAGSIFILGQDFDIGGQKYAIAREDATGGGNNQHVTIYPMNSTTFDKQSSPAKVRLASGWSNAGFPGPTFLQACPGYLEDGMLYALPTYGFPGDVNTTAGSQGRGGTYYADGAGLDHQFIDKLVVRVNDTAARQAAPVGMSVSAAGGVATVGWKNALPQNTYRLYYGTNATTQATLVGDYTGVTSATFSPGTGRFWCKLVTLDNGVERKNRVLSVYVSPSSAFVNEHADRVADDGGSVSTINFPFMDRFDAMLDSVGIRNILELFTHPAAGYASAGAPGGFLKVYDPGTTRLPRSEDFKATTSATTYSATGVNGGPCWVNANNNSYGYWGNPKRGNTIQKKRQITIIVAYERTQTSEDVTFVGTGPIFGNAVTGVAILALKHTAGTPGNIEFSLSDETSTKTASVAASGSGMQIAIGTYDGTDMLAYTGSTAGSAVSTLDPNPNFGKNTPLLTLGYVNGSLAGSRTYINNGTAPPVMPGLFPRIYPILSCGSVHSYVLRRYPVADVMTFTETNAKVKIQCVMALEGAIDSTKIASIISELQSTANW